MNNRSATNGINGRTAVTSRKRSCFNRQRKGKTLANHRATYARDKRNGGWMIRVQGPNANAFAGRTVPVTMMDGKEHLEALETLTWTGKDEQTGQPVALYKFIPKPKDEQEEIEF